MTVKAKAKKTTVTKSTSISTGALDSRPKSLVFISHDSRDADLAEAFSNLLLDVSAGTLKSFRASDKKGTSGIEFGTEWYNAIMLQLGGATDVVALLTQRSIDRPWILYEAGVAKGKLDSNVLGIALGVPLEKVSTGPFGQFQNCADDEDSLTKLVMQLLQRNPEAAPREEAIRRQVQAFRDSATKLVAAKGKVAPAPHQDDSSAAKLFEEIKAMVRELPERVSDRDRKLSRRSMRGGGLRLHPGMLEELLMHPMIRETRGGAATAWLMFLSLLKDDLPWIYESGMPIYRALHSGKLSAIRRSRDSFMRLLEITLHGPFFHELLRREGDETYLLLRRLPRIIDNFLTHASDQGRKTRANSPENAGSES